MVDVSGSEGRDPIDDFETINRELSAYGVDLLKKPMLVAANKIDLVDEDGPEYTRFKEHVEKQGFRVFPISAPIHHGLDELLLETMRTLNTVEQTDQEIPATFFEQQDTERADADYRLVTVSRDEEGTWVLSGKQLRKIFNSTNFNDSGSLRYLYKYLENSGAIRRMLDEGLEEGDTVRIEDFEFEFVDEGL